MKKLIIITFVGITILFSCNEKIQDKNPERDLVYTFTPKLGDHGTNIYLNMKVINGELINSDELDSVLVVDNAIDLDSWIGNYIGSIYIPNISGWSVLTSDSEYGLGNVQVNEKGDIFVDVALYQATPTKYILKTNFQRIWIINKS